MNDYKGNNKQLLGKAFVMLGVLKLREMEFARPKVMLHRPHNFCAALSIATFYN